GTNGGLTQGTETVILQPAGITRLPSVNMLNLRISREFVLNDRWRVIPIVDFFNLTNGQTTVSENNFIDINPANNTYLKPFLTIDQLIDIKHPSNPVWSPDGKHVVFTWDHAGVANLYVADADGHGQPQALTLFPEGQVEGAFWNEDGDTLYFPRDGDLWQVPAT